MKIKDAVIFVGSKFKYTKDPIFYIADLWKVMKNSNVMIGDCEDFALTAM